MATTLSVTDMLPNKFEPKRKFRWVFALEGVCSNVGRLSSILPCKSPDGAAVL